MKEYIYNIKDFLDESLLGEEEIKTGEELDFLPIDEIEANFCTLAEIDSSKTDFSITLAVENEWTGERYKRNYEVHQGSKIEMNMLAPNLACFLPPEKIPVLVEVVEISAEALKIKPIGILQEYVKTVYKNKD